MSKEFLRFKPPKLPPVYLYLSSSVSRPAARSPVPVDARSYAVAAALPLTILLRLLPLLLGTKTRASLASATGDSGEPYRERILMRV